MIYAAETPESAIAILRDLLADAFEEEEAAEPAEVQLGGWADVRVHLDLGLHSEMTPPFMEAFVAIQQEIYRLVAYIKYGASDNRRLTADDLDFYQIKVKVTEGSADYLGELKETFQKLVAAAADKMSGKELAATVIALALIGAGAWGYGTHLEHRKDERLAEIQSEERKQTLQQSEYARRDQAEVSRQLIGLLKEKGGAPAKAVDTAANMNNALLRAASQTPSAEINGIHTTRGEARELRGSSRRQAQDVVVERQMRVVDVNTSDRVHTVVTIEDPQGGAQHRVMFNDRLVQERDTGKLYESLRDRTLVRLRLDARQTGSEIRVTGLLGVLETQEATPAQVAGR